MKKLLIYLISFTVVLISSCEQPTDPEDPGDANNDELLAEGTIGTSGGSISTEEFVIAIPSGALDADQQIQVFDSEAGITGNDIISDVYDIEGLPMVNGKSVRFRIRHTGEVEGNAYIVISHQQFSKGIDEASEVWSYLEAEDSSGYLVAEMPAVHGGVLGKIETGAATVETRISIFGTVSHSLTSAGGHFKIIYGTGTSGSDAGSLAGYLEAAYTKLSEMGFSYASRSKWPMEIYVKDMDSETDGIQSGSVWGYNHSTITINQKRVSNHAVVEKIAAHEFFHAVQEYYDPRFATSRALYASPHYWFEEASAVWFEEKFAAGQNYVPDSRYENEAAPYHGMYQADNSKMGDHGYGMSALVKFLANKYGDKIVLDIFNKIKSGKNAVESIMQLVPVGAESWWPEFLNYYTLGTIYSDIDTDFIVGETNNNNFEIMTLADTLKSFQFSLQSMSGRLFRIELNHNNFSDTHFLNVTLKNRNYTGLTLFAMNNDIISDAPAMSFLGYSTESLPVYGLKQLREQGLDIVGLVNTHKSEAPYNSSISETVDIKVNNFEFDLSMVSYVTVWYNLKIERINYELAAEEDSIYIIETGTEWVDDEWNIYNFDASAFNGSRFSYSGRMYPYHPYFTDSQYQGSIQVGWDETSQSITDFSFEVFNGSGELVHKISGINLPFGYYGIWPALTVNGVFGETSCAYINEFEQKSAIYNPTNGAVLNHLPKFKSYRCDANSWVSVLFHAEGGNVLLSKRFPLRD